MTCSDPQFSVVIAAWNAQNTIERAVRSALEQQGVSVEIIVIDDESTDNTREIVQSIGDNRVSLLKTAKNSGPGVARNLGFSAARAPFVAILDSDDYFLPRRLAMLQEAIVESKADIIADNLKVAYDGVLTDEIFIGDPENFTSGPVGLVEYFRDNLIFDKKRTLGYLKPIFRLDFIREHELKYVEPKHGNEDFYLVAEALASGARFVRYARAGYAFTIARSGSLSNRLNASRAKLMLDSDDEFSAKYLSTLNPAEASAVRYRRSSLDDAFAFLSATESLKNRRVGQAFATMIKRPSSLRHFKLPIQQRIRRLRKGMRPSSKG